jgi:hypothetical protein
MHTKLSPNHVFQAAGRQPYRGWIANSKVESGLPIEAISVKMQSYLTKLASKLGGELGYM